MNLWILLYAVYLTVDCSITFLTEPNLCGTNQLGFRRRGVGRAAALRRCFIPGWVCLVLNATMRGDFFAYRIVCALTSRFAWWRACATNTATSTITTNWLAPRCVFFRRFIDWPKRFIFYRIFSNIYAEHQHGHDYLHFSSPLSGESSKSGFLSLRRAYGMQQCASWAIAQLLVISAPAPDYGWHLAA